MTDLYKQLVTSRIGREIAPRVGLPTPVELRRYEPGRPVVDRRVLLGGAPDGTLYDPAAKVLSAIDAQTVTESPSRGGRRSSYAALVFDASGITRVEDLDEVHQFFHDSIRGLGASGRLIVLGRTPESCADTTQAVAQQALEGFVRSAGKEMRDGATANLIFVDDGAESAIESTLRFALSGRSAFVSGQVLRVGPTTDEDPAVPADWDRPLDGKAAVVTGAAQGIGESIAGVLARDGAHVICLDLPTQGRALQRVANRIGGSNLQLDITDQDAPRRLSEHLRERHDGVDIVVHNAGITRDKTLAGMNADQWRAVLEVNLASQTRINDRLLDDEMLRDHGRVICVSSVSGIAGNRGQTNYAASKAGIIGMVRALAPTVAEQRATINAVAPGFIETQMTGEMPVGPRVVGRLINSLNQGGLPVDVAETIAWLANPGSGWVNGQVVRVCGQSILGA